ncbi:MAG: AAA family ATPase, partial [Solirubrobacterales bacterium]|nr:AAA family ATPase [Solirubrobacterales bacterium]
SNARVFLDCSQHHRHTAFHPITNELRRRLRITAATDHATALSRLTAFVDEAGLSRSDAVPLLAGLLLVDSGTAYPPPALTPRRRRERLLEVLAALLQRLPASRPTLVVVEDFQWADPSTAETVLHLMQQTIQGRVLWLITHRSEHAFPELERLAGHTLDLERLDQNSSLKVARGVAGVDRIPDAVIRAITERADGVPIFLEQLTKSVAEALHRGRDRATPSEVPSSLQASLVARLDRLREGKRVAQAAAVIGRRFATSLLERVAPMPKPHLTEGLNELLRAGLICPDPTGGDGHYLFRHALMRDAAYETLLISTRRRLHYDTARAVTSWFPALATKEPELLGQHLTLADRPTEAIDAWAAAGQAAFRRLNLAEAVGHFRQGLALLPRLAEGDSRNERELALQAGLGAALILTSGYGAPEVETAYGRAFSLCERSGADSNQLFQITWGIWSHKIIRGQHGLGTSAADRLTLIAEGRRDPELRMLAHSAQVLTRCVLGDFLGAEHHASAALALHDPERDRLHALTYSVDPKAMVLMFLQHVLWIRGRSEEADAVGARCLARAEQLGNPFVTPYVLVWGGVPLLYAGRHEALVKRMDVGIARATEACLPFWVSSGGVWRAAGLIGRGEVAEGAALLEESLARLAAAGVRFPLPYRQALLALARCRLGRTVEGAMLAREAFELAASVGEGMYVVEIRRIQGDTLLAQKAPDRAGAERCYLDAIDLARRQASHGWELRAAVSLARLWREEGREAAGLDLVAAATGRLGAHHAPEVDEAMELLGGR